MIAHLGIMQCVDRFSQNFLLARWSVSYFLMYTWNTLLHYPHGANAGCDLAGVAPVVLTPMYGTRSNVTYRYISESLQWRHNERDGVSNHQLHDCLLNRLFRRRSKKTPNSSSMAFVRGNHQSPVNSPHKWIVTRKMFPFDDVIMCRSMIMVGIVLDASIRFVNISIDDQV